MEALRNVGALIGRVLLAIIFIVSGASKFANPAGIAAYMAHAHMPAVYFFLFVAAVIEVGGGILLILGVQARWIALILFLFLIPVTILFHLIPAMTGATAAFRQDMFTHFLKNLAIMGGLLIVVTQGPGGWSVDHAMARGAAEPMPARQTA